MNDHKQLRAWIFICGLTNPNLKFQKRAKKNSHLKLSRMRNRLETQTGNQVNLNLNHRKNLVVRLLLFHNMKKLLWKLRALNSLWNLR